MNIGFLMVGHTHEDVDQMFSCFSKYLNKYEEPVISVEKLCTVVAETFVPSPATFYLTHLFDWKSVLNNHSYHKQGRTTELHGHLRPHQLRFRRDPGHPRCAAKVTWKLWGVDPEWHPIAADVPPTYLLASKVDLSALEMVPLLGPKGNADAQVIAAKDAYDTLRRTARYCTTDEDYQMEQLEVTMNKWLGVDKSFQPIPAERLAELRPVLVFEDIPDNLKWDSGCVGGDGDGGSGDDDGPVLEEDVTVQPDYLIYQGQLDSRNKHALTNTANYVNMDLLAVGNLIIVRHLSDDGENQLFSLCKINSIDEEDRVLSITWWGSRQKENSAKGAQSELQKATDAGSSRGPKNVPYKDTVDFDAVLISENIKLTAKKHVPKKQLDLASRRLKTSIQIMQQRMDQSQNQVRASAAPQAAPRATPRQAQASSNSNMEGASAAPRATPRRGGAPPNSNQRRAPAPQAPPPQGRAPPRSPMLPPQPRAPRPGRK